ncbi:hypothetical protein JCM5353_004348 [Sporobolomyces roseus]
MSFRDHSHHTMLNEDTPTIIFPCSRPTPRGRRDHSTRSSGFEASRFHLPQPEPHIAATSTPPAPPQYLDSYSPGVLPDLLPLPRLLSSTLPLRST